MSNSNRYISHARTNMDSLIPTSRNNPIWDPSDRPQEELMPKGNNPKSRKKNETKGLFPFFRFPQKYNFSTNV